MSGQSSITYVRSQLEAHVAECAKRAEESKRAIDKLTEAIDAAREQRAVDFRQFTDDSNKRWDSLNNWIKGLAGAIIVGLVVVVYDLVIAPKFTIPPPPSNPQVVYVTPDAAHVRAKK